MSTPKLTARDAVGFLVAANGNPKLAAVNASQALGVEISDASLLHSVSEDPTAVVELFRQVRVLSVLNTLDLMRLSQMRVLELLGKMNPPDALNALKIALNAMTQLSAGATAPSVDNFSALLAKLPPQVADAVDYFLQHPDAKVDSPAEKALPDSDHSGPSVITQPTKEAGASPDSHPREMPVEVAA